MTQDIALSGAIRRKDRDAMRLALAALERASLLIPRTRPIHIKMDAAIERLKERLLTE